MYWNGLQCWPGVFFECQTNCNNMLYCLIKYPHNKYYNILVVCIVLEKQEFKEGPTHIAFLVFYPTQNYCLNVRIKGGKEAILLAEKRHCIPFCLLGTTSCCCLVLFQYFTQCKVLISFQIGVQGWTFKLNYVWLYQ